MNFFKPVDFETRTELSESLATRISDLANAKLEREGKVVYGNNKLSLGTTAWHAQATSDTHKAILINIEALEACKHPKENIKYDYSTIHSHFRCECGAHVQPKEFEELK